MEQDGRRSGNACGPAPIGTQRSTAYTAVLQLSVAWPVGLESQTGQAI